MDVAVDPARIRWGTHLPGLLAVDEVRVHLAVAVEEGGEEDAVPGLEDVERDGRRGKGDEAEGEDRDALLRVKADRRLLLVRSSPVWCGPAPRPYRPPAQSMGFRSLTRAANQRLRGERWGTIGRGS